MVLIGFKRIRFPQRILLSRFLGIVREWMNLVGFVLF